MLSALMFGLMVMVAAAFKPADQSSAALIPSGVVGVPYAYNIGYGVGQIESFPGASVTYSYTLTGGSLPPGLMLDSTGQVTGVPQLAGDFVFDTLFLFQATVDGQSVNLSLPDTFTISVSGTSGSKVIAQPGGLVFAMSQGGPALTQAILISNRSAQSAPYSISVVNGSKWISVSPAGSVDPFTAASVPVTTNPAGLSTGTYTDELRINISSTGESFTTVVVATVSGDAPAITLSNTGLRFQSVVGGGRPLPQNIAVLDSGAQPLNYSVSATTLIAGQHWLAVTPGTGSNNPGSLSSFSVAVEPAGLGPGTYYGQVLFATTDSDFQLSAFATIVLNVYSPQESPGAEAIPTGLLFIGQAGGPDPAAKAVSITNPSTSPLTYITLNLDTPTDWLNVQPSSGTVSPGGPPLNLSVQPSLHGLVAGIYRGDLVLRFEEDNAVRHIQILLIVTPSGNSMAAPAASTHADPPTCTPATLQMVFNQIPESYQVVVGYPQSLGVAIADNCGNPMTSGTVTATFSNGDPELELVSLQDGNWTVSWTPYFPSANMTISVDAQQKQPALEAIAVIGGSALANTATPTVKGGGIVSAASFAIQRPVAPGSYIAIFGANLSQKESTAQELPLPSSLGDTTVALGGMALPLLYTSDGQINALVPYGADAFVNATRLLSVVAGTAYSSPVAVPIASAQPSVFTQNQSGTGAGVIVVVKADGTQFLNTPTSPATGGDTLVIYCSGLGVVNPPVSVGSAAPSSPPATTVHPVTATIGGEPARVLFSGLAPLYAGLYQVNAVVPSGLTPSENVPIILSAANQSSAPVTVAIR